MSNQYNSLSFVARLFSHGVLGAALLASHGAVAGPMSTNPNRIMFDLPSSYTYEAPGQFKMDASTGDITGMYMETRGAFFNNLLELGLSYNYLDGQSRYQNTGGDGSASTDTGDDTIHQLELHAGVRQSWTHFDTVLFAGIGLRHWSNQLHGTPSEPVEEVTTVYAYNPLGIRFEGPLSADWHWETRLQYNRLIEGMVTTHFSQLDSTYSDTENSQTSGKGYELSFTLRRSFSGGRFGMAVEPYLQVWDIERSDDQPVVQNGSVVEMMEIPANESTVAGIRFGLEF